MRLAWFILLISGVTLISAHGADSAEVYEKEIQPILQKHCYECHGPEKHKADLNLASITNFAQIKADPSIWQAVLERVQAYEMPPKGQPELDFSAHGKLMEWLRGLPRPEKTDCDQVASDRNTSFYRGYVMSRRLNRAEYHNTLRDLFRYEFQVDDQLPADGGGGEGFDTSGNALFTSAIHIEKYLSAADQILKALFASTNAVGSSLDAAKQRLLIARPGPALSARGAAQKVVDEFAHRAFRGLVPEGEIERLMRLYDRAAKRGDDFEQALQLPLKAVLVSPSFLFLAEPEPEARGLQPLAGVPLASKLSYFLWASMPDEELLALGENGDLLKDQIYREQVQRMLADPKAAALGERFAIQWLDLERLGTEVHADPAQYPEFTPELVLAMRTEVTEFFNHLVREDRPLLDLIDSDYTYLNEPLAKLYAVSGVSGPAFRRVQFTDTHRGGVIGMAAIEALTCYPTRTSPVLRGHWLMEALLGEKVPPPPPDVPALDQTSAKVAKLSLREQLEVHRSRTECAGCHSKMDPLGFSMENFDVLGRWRDTDRGLPIDSQGVLPSGEKFTGPAGLKAVLMQRKDEVVKHLVRKMAGFAFGRELNRFDQCTVDRTVEALKANDYRASVLLEQIATSFPFRHRFYAKQDLSVNP